MKHQPATLLLFVGVFLATLALGPLCSAQDYSGGGLGNTPMPPVSPTAPGNRDLPAIPGPPTQPPNASRPSTWPGGGPTETSPMNSSQGFQPQRIDPVGAMPGVDMKPFDKARIIARVGTEAILESDLIVRGGPPNFEVVGSIDTIIEQNKDQIPPNQMDQQREMLIKKILQGVIQSKMILLDAKKTIPAEGMTQFEAQLTKMFEEEELERLLKRAGVTTSQELNRKFLALGTSLEREKRAFIERTLVQQWIRQQIKRDEEVTDQMISYYHSNLKDFTTPARAKWEELMTSYSKYPSKDAARDALAKLGNQVFTGAPFAEVAKAGSNGITASSGGGRDWTTKGSLACQELDRALFGLPIGQLSPIIEGPAGLHIVRVTIREEEKVTPFRDAQVEIKKKIIEKHTEKQYQEYISKVQEKTPVWTIFDGDAAKAPIKEPLSNRPRELLR